jgi:hypothetical protein
VAAGAFVAGLHGALLLAGLLTAVAALIVWLGLRPRAMRSADETPVEVPAAATKA